MRRHQLFAAGVSVALLLGAATPALAKSDKGKALGHEKHPAASRPAKGPKPAKQKPAKKTPATKGKKSGVSGGGVVTDGTFSIQARKSRGHFNYTSTNGSFKVRCREGFEPFTPVLGATERTAKVTFKACQVTGQPGPVPITVDVTDRGQPSVTPAVADWIGFSVTNAAAVTTAYGGNLTDGNIKVR